MSWRLLNLDGKTPSECRALREVFLLEIEEKRSPNTVAFTCLEAYVLLGERSNYNTINVDECKTRNIPIVRTKEAGDTTLYTPTVFNFCIAYDVSEGTQPAKSLDARALIKEIIIEVCRKYGVTATPRHSKNDVLAGGRKLCGMAVRQYGNCMLASVIFTIDFDYDLADTLLDIPDSKFEDKPHKTVRDWVTSLRKESGIPVSMDDVKAILIATLEAKFDMSLNEGQLTAEENSALDKLTEKYNSESWLKYGKWSPIKDYWRPP